MILGGPKITLGALRPWMLLAEKYFYTQNEYFGISNCIFNSNLLALVVSNILGRSQIYTIREPTHPWRPLAEKFLFAKRVLYNIKLCF